MAKKLRLMIPVLLLVLLLCGCSHYEGPSVGQNVTSWSDTGDSYSLRTSQMELTYNGTTYSYDVGRSGDTISYTIYYPNGGTYYETRGGDVETGGWNDKYAPGSTYASGEKLVDILSRHYYISHSSPNFGHVLILMVCLGIGCFNIFLPETAWRLEHLFRRWQYESIEPSDLGITWTRVGGVIIIIMGVIMFFWNWS